MRPTLVINPRDDPAFVELANSLVHDGHTTSEGLQAALLTRYPNVRVRARDLEAEEHHVFYVYRDGHWTSYRGAEPVGDAEDDLKSTSRDLVADAARLEEIETGKSRLDPSLPRVLELSLEAEEIADIIRVKTAVETAIAKETSGA